VRFAVEQRSLAAPAQIGAEQNADAVNFTAQNDRVVVRVGETVFRGGVKHPPVCDPIATLDLSQASGRMVQAVQDAAIRGRSGGSVAGEELAGGKLAFDQ